jgi:hypothetical protein
VRPWRKQPTVVLDTVLVREISQTREQLQSLMRRLADFDARLTAVAELVAERDPLIGQEGDRRE